MALYDESRVKGIHTDIYELRRLITKIDGDIQNCFVGSTGTIDQVESKLRIKNHGFFNNNISDTNAGGTGTIDRQMDGLVSNLSNNAKNW